MPQKSPKEKKLKTPVKPEIKISDSKEKTSKKDSDASPSLRTAKDKKEVKVDKSKDEKLPSRDDMFREFRRLCYTIADENAYLEKTAIVKKMFTKGSQGGKFVLKLRISTD